MIRTFALRREFEGYCDRVLEQIRWSRSREEFVASCTCLSKIQTVATSFVGPAVARRLVCEPRPPAVAHPWDDGDHDGGKERRRLPRKCVERCVFHMAHGGSSVGTLNAPSRLGRPGNRSGRSASHAEMGRRQHMSREGQGNDAKDGVGGNTSDEQHRLGHGPAGGMVILSRLGQWTWS